MVTDAQVRVLRRKRMEGKTQEGAAAAAGMSVRAARTWEHGPLPSQTTGPRSWRTRSDPFAAVWETEVLPLLEADADGGLEATTIFDALRDGHPEQFEPGQLRTLQRRMHLLEEHLLGRAVQRCTALPRRCSSSRCIRRGARRSSTSRTAPRSG
jgi:hypothetical protein